MNRNELLAAIKEKEIIIGFNRSLKLSKDKKAEMVIVSENCPENFRNELGKVEIFEGNSKDLGIVCGKPFNISVLAVVK